MPRKSIAQKKDDGGTAFPATDYFDEKPIGTTDGLSIRDYFAARAMGALISHYETDDPQQARSLAYLSYKAADAMIAERAK